MQISCCGSQFLPLEAVRHGHLIEDLVLRHHGHPSLRCGCQVTVSAGRAAFFEGVSTGEYFVGAAHPVGDALAY